MCLEQRYHKYTILQGPGTQKRFKINKRNKVSVK